MGDSYAGVPTAELAASQLQTAQRLHRAGSYDEAHQAYLAAVDSALTYLQPEIAAEALRDCALMIATTGDGQDLDEVTELLHRALNLDRGRGDVEAESRNLMALAQAFAIRGEADDLKQVAALYRDALSLLTAPGRELTLGVIDAQVGLAESLRSVEGDPGASATVLAMASEIYREKGDPRRAADTDARRALKLLDQKKPGDAEQLLTRVSQFWRSEVERIDAEPPANPRWNHLPLEVWAERADLLTLLARFQEAAALPPGADRGARFEEIQAALTAFAGAEALDERVTRDLREVGRELEWTYAYLQGALMASRGERPLSVLMPLLDDDLTSERELLTRYQITLYLAQNPNEGAAFSQAEAGMEQVDRDVDCRIPFLRDVVEYMASASKQVGCVDPLSSPVSLR